MPERNFLSEVYGDVDNIGQFYDEWASTYDNSVLTEGYISPRRCAKALSGIVSNLTSPILDYGCGTGISGDALAGEGFLTIDGCDISEAMLEGAKAKQVYRRLWICGNDAQPPCAKGEYTHIAAIGVISVGAAGIDVLDTLMDVLPEAGTLTFSLNDHTLMVPEYLMRINEYVDVGGAEIIFKEYGEHLPGLELNSTVFILKKR